MRPETAVPSSEDVVGQVANPSAEPRRCSSRPSIASVGPLLVPGPISAAEDGAERRPQASAGGAGALILERWIRQS